MSARVQGRGKGESTAAEHVASSTEGDRTLQDLRWSCNGMRNV